MVMETTMTKKVTMNRKLMILKSLFFFDMNIIKKSFTVIENLEPSIAKFLVYKIMSNFINFIFLFNAATRWTRSLLTIHKQRFPYKRAFGSKITQIRKENYIKNEVFRRSRDCCRQR